MNRPAKCPSCQSELTVIKREFSKILGLPDDFPSNVRACRYCGLRFLWPYFSDTELSAIYAKEYFVPSTEVEDSNDALPRAPSAYDGGVDKFNGTLNLLLRLNPTAKSILDIGASNGDFLALARERGLDVQGIEYSEYAAQEALKKHNLTHFVGTTEEYPKGRRFDIIHLNHVLEHLPDPNSAVAHISQLLSESGIVYVEVPFQFNVCERIMHKWRGQRRSFNLFSLHHAIFFDPQTLTALFLRYGMKPRMLRVFEADRYPAYGLVARGKKVAWKMLSYFGQGCFIECIFETGRADERR